MSPGQRHEAELLGERIDLFEFGKRFANQLNPLQPAPREWQFMANRNTGYGYARGDETVNTLSIRISRILGYAWENATKLSVRDPTPPELDDA